MIKFILSFFLIILGLSLVIGTVSVAGPTSAPENELQSLIVEEVTFQNEEVTLAGSLVFLKSQFGAKKPAIIFVPGSGEGPRTWFKGIAQYYASQGFVALIYDKRGSGMSGGNWITSSLEDLAGDVVAGLELLKNDPKVDPDRIGIFGVSQGGWVIPKAASLTQIPAFGIIISGGGAKPRLVETAVKQGALFHGGASKDEVQTAMALLDDYFIYLSTGNGFKALDEKIENSKTESWYPSMPLGDVLPSPGNRPNWSWVANYDPGLDIAKLSFPVLVMLGGQDFLSPVDLAAPAWRAGFETSDAAASKVVIFEEGGHGLVLGQHGQAIKGEATFIDGYFETQFQWLKEIEILPD